MNPADIHAVYPDTGYDAGPSVLIASGSDEGRLAATAAAQGVAVRVLASVGLEDAAEALDRLVSVSAVIVDAVHDRSGERLPGLAARLNGLAAEGACRSVVIVSPEMIDPVYAVAPHADVTILCEPTASDLLASLAFACAPRPLRLNDVAGEAGSIRLVQLAEEAGRIARALANLAENTPSLTRVDPGDFPPPPPLTVDVAAAAANHVRSIIRARRTRDQFFRSELFADPAWDILLDLMAARLEHKRVSVSSLCIAAAVPATTALRWIKSMTEEGLLVRRADNNDGRRIFIELSDNAAGALTAYLGWLKNNSLTMV